jgi:hypothetical protein
MRLGILWYIQLSGTNACMVAKYWYMTSPFLYTNIMIHRHCNLSRQGTTSHRHLFISGAWILTSLDLDVRAVLIALEIRDMY